MTFFLFSFIFLISFSYTNFLGVRVLLFQIMFGMMFLLYTFFRKKRAVVKATPSIFIFVIFLFVFFVCAVLTSNYDQLMALVVFMLIFFVTIQINYTMLDRVIKYYLYTVLFIAIGLLSQVVVHKTIGIELFRYQLFGGNRNAYSFLWEDYSFLSLFFVSAVPLLFRNKINIKSCMAAFFLMTASLATSARTGIAALLLYFFLLIIQDVIKAIVSGKINKLTFVLIVASVVVPLLVFYGLTEITGRVVTTSSSGRIDDFVLGWHYFLERPFLGFLFDKEAYISTVSIIPHNVFIYMLYMGGGVSLLLFLLWSFFIALEIRKAEKPLLGAIFVCFWGVQFIPSFFSAYFMAILLGFAVVSSANTNAISIKRDS